jgi:WD40 repeat protein
VWGLAFSPDSTWLVTGGPYDGRLRIWDVVTAHVRKEIPFPGGNVRMTWLTLSPDGTRVATTEEDEQFTNQRLTVFDIASGQSLF